jgi:hypothetical protein
MRPKVCLWIGAKAGGGQRGRSGLIPELNAKRIGRAKSKVDSKNRKISACRFYPTILVARNVDVLRRDLPFAWFETLGFDSVVV